MSHSKIILSSVAALALLGAPVALADHHGGKGGKMFERMDTDGDGKISSTEHIAASQERFTKLDSNGDGFITKDEAKDARGKMREKVKEKIEERRENSVE